MEGAEALGTIQRLIQGPRGGRGGSSGCLEWRSGFRGQWGQGGVGIPAHRHKPL